MTQPDLSQPPGPTPRALLERGLSLLDEERPRDAARCLLEAARLLLDDPALAPAIPAPSEPPRPRRARPSGVFRAEENALAQAYLDQLGLGAPRRA